MANSTDRFSDPLGLTQFPYRFKTVSERCAAFIEPNGLSNIGVIIGKDGLVLVDSSIHPYYAIAIKAFVERRFERPILHLVNTHFHRDHTFGNHQIAPKEGVIAHTLCADYFDRYAVQMRDEHSSFYAPEGVKLRTPDVLFSDQRWIIPGFQPTIEVIQIGGHTHDSCLVWVPEEGVVFSGDTVFNRVRPYVGEYSCVDHFGKITDWLDALQTVMDLNPEVIVPGHGVLARNEDVLRLQMFFNEFYQKVALGVEQGLSLKELWQGIYRRECANWHGADHDLYLYMTSSLFDELKPMPHLYEKLSFST